MSRGQILELIAGLSGDRFRPNDVHAAAVEHGHDITTAAMRQHLRRMVKARVLHREGDDYLKPGAASNGHRAAQDFSPTAAATAEGEEREMRLTDGSREGPG